MKRVSLEKTLSIFVISILVLHIIISPVPIATANNAPLTVPGTVESPLSMLNKAIDQLSQIDGLSTSDRAVMGETLKKLNNVARAEFWDESHIKSLKPFTEGASAIQQLQATKIYKDDASSGRQAIESAVALILQSDKELANISISNASAALLHIDNAATWQEMRANIDKAQKKYAQAEDQLLKGNDVPAIEAYKNAWSDAGKAIDLADSKTTPVPTILYPADGTYVSTPAVTLSGTIDDVATYTISQVTVIVNGREIACAVSDGRFSLPVELVEGRNVISVVARDRANNYGYASATVILDTRAPIITIENLIEGRYYNTSLCPSVAVDEANLKALSITLDGARYDGALITAEGSHVLEVHASDLADNQADVARSFTIDLTSPVPYISGISADSYLGRTVTIEGGATDANLDRLSLLINGIEVSNVLPYLWDTALCQDGRNTVELRAMDKAKNSAAILIPVNVDNTLPVVRWLCPVNGTMFGSSLLTFRWDGKDNGGISDYQLFLGDQLISRTTDTEYLMDSLADGSYNATVNIYDLAGNVGFNTSSFIVDTMPPVILIDGVEEGRIYNYNLTPVINATDANLQAVGGTLNSQPYDGQAIVDEGNYSLYVWADDLPGNRAEQRVNFSVDKTPPALQVEELTDNPTLVNLIYKINITAEPGAEVKINNETVVNEVCFNYSVLLSAGANEINVTATDAAGNVASWVKTRLIDDDLLPDYYETDMLGMDPLSSDSDSNRTAVNESSNSLSDDLEDLDADDLNNGLEYWLGTDPVTSDSDSDGLLDGFEFARSLTSPLSNDTAGDGIGDALSDYDCDCLNNLQEQSKGTNPRNGDTDGDGLDDGREIVLGTNPLVPDTDNDGLADDSEVKIRTDPLNPDSDGDGMPDGQETYTTAAVDETLGVTVTVTGIGDVSKQVTIANVTSEYFVSNPALVTPLVDIKVNGPYESATVTLQYDPARVSDPTNVTLCCWNETYGYYEPLDSVVDTANHTITATAPHFSFFGGFFVPLINQIFNEASRINRAATNLFNNVVDTIRLTIRNTVNVFVKTNQNGVPTTRQYTLPTYMRTATPTPSPTPTPTASPVPTPFPTYVPPPVPSDAFKEPYAYISNSNANIVSVVNTYDNSIVASIPTSARPGEIAISSDGNRVYVSNGNRVSVIDARTNRVIYDIPFNYGTDFLALSPDNARLYVVNNGGISCVDLSNTQVIGRINDVPNIAGMDISKDGQYIFTSNYWDGTLEVSSTSSFTRIKTIRCAPDSAYQSWSYFNGHRYYSCGVATSVSTSHDGQHVYVSLWSSNDMGIINAQTLTRENTITLGYRSSDGVTVSPDDHVVYATNFDAGSISVVNADTQALAYSIPVGTHPRRIDASHDGKYIFVCLEGGYVKSVDRANANAVTTIPIYGNSVRLNPAQDTVWPSQVDSDNDLLPDGVEKQFMDMNGKLYSSDPFNRDTDGDGLDDGEEAGVRAGTGRVLLNGDALFSVVANPQKVDSDNDRLMDPVEMEIGTRPLDVDYDKDKLPDGDEVLGWDEQDLNTHAIVHVYYGTDPLQADTDGDSWDDYKETISPASWSMYSYMGSSYGYKIRIYDPLIYEQHVEILDAFVYGIQHGTNLPSPYKENYYSLLGGTISSFLPVYGPARDGYSYYQEGDANGVIMNAGFLVLDLVTFGRAEVLRPVKAVVKVEDETSEGAKAIGALAENAAKGSTRKATILEAIRIGDADGLRIAIRDCIGDDAYWHLTQAGMDDMFIAGMITQGVDVRKLDQIFVANRLYQDYPGIGEHMMSQSLENGVLKGRVTINLKRLTTCDRSARQITGDLNNLRGFHGEACCREDYMGLGQFLIDISPVNKPGMDMAKKVVLTDGYALYMFEVKTGPVTAESFRYFKLNQAGQVTGLNVNYAITQLQQEFMAQGKTFDEARRMAVEFFTDSQCKNKYLVIYINNPESQSIVNALSGEIGTNTLHYTEKTSAGIIDGDVTLIFQAVSR